MKFVALVWAEIVVEEEVERDDLVTGQIALEETTENPDRWPIKTNRFFVLVAGHVDYVGRLDDCTIASYPGRDGFSGRTFDGKWHSR